MYGVIVGKDASGYFALSKMSDREISEDLSELCASRDAEFVFLTLGSDLGEARRKAEAEARQRGIARVCNLF